MEPKSIFSMKKIFGDFPVIDFSFNETNVLPPKLEPPVPRKITFLNFLNLPPMVSISLIFFLFKTFIKS